MYSTCDPFDGCCNFLNILRLHNTILVYTYKISLLAHLAFESHNLFDVQILFLLLVYYDNVHKYELKWQNRSSSFSALDLSQFGTKKLNMIA